MSEAPAADGAADLVAGIVAGDPAAEARLFERYSQGVALVLDRRTGGRPEAEDLLQETFRLALEKLRAGELREPEKLPAFLAQIARFTAIEHYRKLGRRKTEADSEGLAAVADARRGPLDALLDRERAELARQVIGELTTARDREVLLRFYVAEEEKERIEADLGLSSLQLNRVLHRARQRYKERVLGRLGERAGVLFGAIVALVAPLSLGRVRLLPG